VRTGFALFDMTAERSSATNLDRCHHATLGETDMAGVGAAPCRAMQSEDIGYFEMARVLSRVAITNSRLVDMDDTHVRFCWKDYQASGKVVQLEIAEFIRRFLLHVLPGGFQRIRHYGFLANGHRAEKLALCRSLLDSFSSRPNDHDSPDDKHPGGPNQQSPPCPCCGGRMKIIDTFEGSVSRHYEVRRPDAL
jgi:hypothetical protein